jgi:hypothetical protein
MRKHLWPLAALPLTTAMPAVAYDVAYDVQQPQFDQHSDWAYTDSATPDALRYRPFHFQIGGGPALTQQSAGQDLSSGWDAGAGFTWNPSRYVPFGIRADASYSSFGVREPLLNQTSAQTGTTVDFGTASRWGADLDGELDVPLTPEARLYLVAGGGWYKTTYSYGANEMNPALFCTFWGCQRGYINQNVNVLSATTPWQYARNAGLGVEIGMGAGTSFFVEARYMRIGPSADKQDFIPIRFGLRF